jgi:hypothetical protein
MTPSAHNAGGRRVRRWTRELIIEKILEWDARYGEPPSSADWNPSLARWRAQEWRAERYRDGNWPSTNAAKRPFGGSFDAAIRAAGLEPRRPGPRRGVGEARPAVEQRVHDDRTVASGNGAVAAHDHRVSPGDALAVALERARRAEARATALERELLVAEGRAERAEAKVGDARRRARRASDQAGRARRARDAVRVARRDSRSRTLERLEELLADADARVRAADDQAEAAVRDAAEARQATAAAEQRARELSALVANGQRRLTAGELAALRSDGPSGPAVLAGALRRLAKARAGGDRGGLRTALGEVASAAVRWHDRL